MKDVLIYAIKVIGVLTAAVYLPLLILHIISIKIATTNTDKVYCKLTQFHLIISFSFLIGVFLFLCIFALVRRLLYYFNSKLN